MKKIIVFLAVCFVLVSCAMANEEERSDGKRIYSRPGFSVYRIVDNTGPTVVVYVAYGVVHGDVSITAVKW